MVGLGACTKSSLVSLSEAPFFFNVWTRNDFSINPPPPPEPPSAQESSEASAADSASPLLLRWEQRPLDRIPGPAGEKGGPGGPGLSGADSPEGTLPLQSKGVSKINARRKVLLTSVMLIKTYGERLILLQAVQLPHGGGEPSLYRPCVVRLLHSNTFSKELFFDCVPVMPERIRPDRRGGFCGASFLCHIINAALRLFLRLSARLSPSTGRYSHPRAHITRTPDSSRNRPRV